MIINSIQRYQLDVRLNCKAQSIAKEICKNVGRENTPAFTKLVKKRISRDIKFRIGFRRIDMLTVEQYSAYISQLIGYEFYYCDKLYK